MQRTADPLISVVVPTFNRRQTLQYCLAALAFQTLPVSQWEVIVVNDGSTDETAEFLSGTQWPFQLTVLSQANQGAGAARRAGVAAARGNYVLLCNDDTIASSTLLEEHVRLQKQFSGKSAILGQFYPSPECGRRALSFWINHSPFLFPQQTLRAGQICDQALFVTCNLSLRRQLLLEAGNFDGSFRVAEDTEMGARLALRECKVRFEPSATATHEHANFTADDLLRRAQTYAAATWQLMRKHPHLLGDGSGPFGRLEPADLQRLRVAQKEKAEAAQSGIAALRALDDFDLAPLWLKNAQDARPADALVEKLTAIVPTVYWHSFFQQFLAESEKENAAVAVRSLSEPAAEVAAT